MNYSLTLHEKKTTGSFWMHLGASSVNKKNWIFTYLDRRNGKILQKVASVTL